jgi:chemotaxis signal transduction protein
VPLTKILAIPADAGGQAYKARSRFLKSIIQREEGVAALLDVTRILEEIKLE